MQIHVPEDLSGDLRLLPEGTYEAAIQDFFLGKSKEGNPKLTCKWVITSEWSESVSKTTGKVKKGYVTTVGENILDNFSLLPQSLWKLNSLWKAVTGEKLPHGDYDANDLLDKVKSALVGAAGHIDVYTDDGSGEERSNIKAWSF